MASKNEDEYAGTYEPTYRQQDVDETLEDHEQRITDNERRWLIAKGFGVALALVKGTEWGLDYLMQFI